MIQIFFFADSHLGFDLPRHPKIKRRRRGFDFYDNYCRILEAAVEEGADLIIHGGDFFFRSRIDRKLIFNSFQPLIRVAEKGIPIFIVPGNHERSKIPQSLFTLHPKIFIFNSPRNFYINIGSATVKVSGFPFVRNGIRSKFSRIIKELDSQDSQRFDISLLCMHQAVDGATVGPSDYIFKYGEDIINIDHIPHFYTAILSGHIHRHQVLKENLCRNPLPVNVYYPGSIERTSFAEKDEDKGFYVFEVKKSKGGDCWIFHSNFRELPARPMHIINIDCHDMSEEKIKNSMESLIKRMSRDAIVKIKIRGNPAPGLQYYLSSGFLRSVFPPTMNVMCNWSYTLHSGRKKMKTR
jgi:DNA repair exonuclease SbcCD nuclease subunit